LLVAMCLGVWAQQEKPPAPAPVEPPEEDESLKEREYSFNPLQAQKEFNVGNFYFKKGSYKAAAMRYEEAVKWNPGYAEAYLRLGEAREKLGQKREAIEAYKAFLENAPDHKRAAEIRKKLPADKPSSGS
jgi:tetratricopeptide (TPR) repeat protein